MDRTHLKVWNLFTTRITAGQIPQFPSTQSCAGAEATAVHIRRLPIGRHHLMIGECADRADVVHAYFSTALRNSASIESDGCSTAMRV
ncbi:hypothetical protein Pth03_62790 [Planotetraspora thailandica]|uniref:Uncharacterized protein n=1 Tax=Planotetraspora thailandica TaxID=487172 RepID=A0A8J3XYT5_9ACTN|nr:hypothetical protein Pth03_62790 [Planotetraspora thailandica]